MANGTAAAGVGSGASAGGAGSANPATQTGSSTTSAPAATTASAPAGTPAAQPGTATGTTAGTTQPGTATGPTTGTSTGTPTTGTATTTGTSGSNSGTGQSTGPTTGATGTSRTRAHHPVAASLASSNFNALVLGLVCAVGLVIFGLAGLYFYVYRDQTIIHETSRAIESRIAAENAINSARRAEADAAIKVVEARAESEKYKQERIVPQPYGFLVTPRTVVDLSTNSTPPAPTPATPSPSSAPASVITPAETNGSVGHVTITNFVTVVQQQVVLQQPPQHQQIISLPAGVYWQSTPMIERYGYDRQAQQGFNGYFYFGR